MEPTVTKSVALTEAQWELLQYLAKNEKDMTMSEKMEAEKFGDDEAAETYLECNRNASAIVTALAIAS
jgi:hypothetical protein